MIGEDKPLKAGKLSDSTRVCGVYWKRLKENAMKNSLEADYIEVSTFA